MLTILFTLLVMFSPFEISGLLLTYCESTTELVVWGDTLPSNPMLEVQQEDFLL